MTYLSTVLADNPTHYWRLADPGGPRTVDLGSAAFDVALSSFFSLFSYSGISTTGRSRWFQSNNGILSFDTVALNSPVSFEAWIWPQSHATGAYIIAHDGVSSTQNLDVVLRSDGFLQFDVGATALVGTHPVTMQHWHHIVATWDGTTAKIYKDAVLDNSVAVAGTFTTAHQFAIGVNSGSSSGFAGAITECAVYGAALTPTQINNHFLAQEVTTSPIFQILGAVSGVGGGIQDVDAVLAAIYNAVIKTFPST